MACCTCSASSEEQPCEGLKPRDVAAVARIQGALATFRTAGETLQRCTGGARWSIVRQQRSASVLGICEYWRGEHWQGCCGAALCVERGECVNVHCVLHALGC